jgi:hypothetical protein
MAEPFSVERRKIMRMLGRGLLSSTFQLNLSRF